MLKVLKSHLLKVIDDIDTGNSNISDEEELMKVIDVIKELTNKEKGISKYKACQYLNISRATFDNYVRAGKIPRGVHEAGFKELRWYKKDLDNFIRKEKT